LISSGGVTEFCCTDSDTCLLTPLEFKVQDGGDGEVLLHKSTQNAVHPLSTFAILSAPPNQ
jgi:hypothetical protein